MKIPHPHIFKRYDIRGIAGVELTDTLVEGLGKAVGTHLGRGGARNAAVGRDGRLSGEGYMERFIEGVLSTGMDVFDLGMCPTPVVYFAVPHLGAGGAVAVTASHNPPQYNGFKVCRGLGSIYDEEIQALRALMETEDFDRGSGRRTSRTVLDAYVEDLVGRFGAFESRPHLVVDAGNGTAALAAPEILRRLKCRVVELYCHVDGNFPNHEADPTVLENLRDMIGLVGRQGCSLGVAFDGDADRIGVVDETGAVLHGDQLLLLYARVMLKERPGATVISEVKSSKTLYDGIAAAGGRPLMWKTGHSLIKAKMKETGALLAGEMSGHMFFADRYYGFDDAVYAACRLLEILDRSGKSLRELRESIPAVVNTPELRVACPEESKEPLVRRLLEHYRKTRPVIDIDGVRVEFPDGWGLVRASNTQPILVVRFEAGSSQGLDEIRRDMTDAINGYGVDLNVHAEL